MINPPEVGDLVYHLLYGRDWNGLLLDITLSDSALGARELALVYLIPGTKHQFWFKKQMKKYRINDRRGYVSFHWLRSLQEVVHEPENTT